jgi:hypothetical protein
MTTTLDRFRSLMDFDSLLIVHYANWHPLAARTIYWFFRSLLSPRTFLRPKRTHAACLFEQNYRPTSKLVEAFAAAGLVVQTFLKSPYLAHPSWERHFSFLDCLVPDFATHVSLFFLRKDQAGIASKNKKPEATTLPASSLLTS